MTKVGAQGEKIRRFILGHVEQHPSDISKKTAEHFGITRQAVHRHLRHLVTEKALLEHGQTRSRSYKLAPTLEWRKVFTSLPELAEDVIWRNEIAPTIGQLPENVMHIWHYGFTEIFNNAIDHSEGTAIRVDVRKNAATTEITISDNGVGIFKKIQTALGLLDERHAVLELSKGKLTTDPSRHSGEGIFFCSRMFDDFGILSGGVFFSHVFGDSEDWILEHESIDRTIVWMKLDNHTSRTSKKIFDQHTTGEGYRFDKTIVPVKIAQYGDEQLISRSQAKRLVAGIEKFKIVIFDFSGVDMIGQAFADEVFRVFAKRHTGVNLKHINANAEVMKLIERATSTDIEKP